MLIFIGTPILFYLLVDFILRIAQNKNKKKEENSIQDENAKLREELEKLRSEKEDKEE
jgi:cell division protein FtsB